MTDISFSPTFKHVAWVDNRDRVAASGQNGFNVRFDAIQKDLENLSKVVGQIDTGLKAVGQRPTVKRLLSLAPTFSPVENKVAWVLDGDGVASRSGATDTSLSGILTVAPPDGSQLLTLRATGQNTGNGSLNVTLYRTSLVTIGRPESIAQVKCSGGAFGEAQPVPPGKDRVDMARFNYFVDASLVDATPGGSVYITSIQLSYNVD
ncbi:MULTISPECIES: hypothetical protein [Streptomyces]|uniref:Uncharacterized protein n=1 Tax=Streptomyces venezuelae TaxID=54571 RepID=A0A5P2B102_STRVZ|nr:hypothetical protein [Streptomyces venezuelae]QES24252.1 hypothetical protein DEJ46_38440 [Streptomyces venezuelae]